MEKTKIKFTKQKFFLIILIFFLFLVLFFLFFNNKKPYCEDCNVILISIDTLRSDHLGCYGYDKNTSPNIDTFSESSILFKKSFSQSSWTMPSHMSMFTGLLPSKHRLNDIQDTNNLDENITTISEILKENNYNTVWIAPLHVPFFNLERGFERGYSEFLLSEESKLSSASYPEDIWDNFHRWIEKNSDEKFFMFLHTYHTHFPYFPKKKSLDRFNPDINHNTFPTNYIEYFKIFDDLNSTCMDSWNTLCSESIRVERYIDIIGNDSEKNNDFISLYDAEIYEIDKKFQEVIETLKKQKIENKTIIILTSDHGEEFHEHEDYGHGTSLYSETTSVPLIIYIPNFKNKISDKVAQNIDLYPTILGLLKIHKGSVDGIDLFSNKRSIIIIKEILPELISVDFLNWRYIARLASDENHKYVLEDKSELYNLNKDPYEKNNLVYKRKIISSIFKKIIENKYPSYEFISI